MYRKCIVVFLCFLAVSSYALAGQWSFQHDWHNTTPGVTTYGGWVSTHTTSDFFDPCNWAFDPAYNGIYGPCPNMPDWTCYLAVEPKHPDPCIYKDAACIMLDISPWNTYTNPPPYGLVTVTAGDVNVGWQINVGGGPGFLSALSPDFGWATLDVNGGVVHTGGCRNFDANDPYNPNKFDDPNYQYIQGNGILIGGGRGNPGNSPFWGFVNIRNDGQLIVPRFVLQYGEVNIFGGLLYDTNDSLDNFFIAQGRPSWHKVNVAGGELRLASNRVSQINYYVGKGLICACENKGMLFINYDGDTNVTSVTAVCSPDWAWNPTPKDQATNITLNPTLTWSPGSNIAYGAPNGHRVYFGTDFNEVNDATTATAGIYKGVQDAASYVAPGPLGADTAYYWRIEEVNTASGSSPFHGWTWQFRTVGGAAVAPNPVNGTVGLPVPLQLSWQQGAFAQKHEVYVGTDFNNVRDATLGNLLGVAEVNVDTNVFVLGSLPWDLQRDTNYYWRVDEYNSTKSPYRWIGNDPEVWPAMFRNTNYFVVDDFNSYVSSDDMNQYWASGYSAPGCSPARTAYAGLTWVGPGQLQYYYNNMTTTVSEARRIINGADWTGGGALPTSDPIVGMSVSYLGDASNDTNATYDRMWMGVEDTTGHFGSVTNTDPNANRNSFGWNRMNVKLSDLGMPSTVIQTAVKYVYIGFGTRCYNGSGGGSGTMQFDDLRLWQKYCAPDLNVLNGDFTLDCKVDIADVNYFADAWLTTDTSITLPMSNPDTNGLPKVWYKFDETGGTGATIVHNFIGDGNDGEVIYNATPPPDHPTLASHWDPNGGFDGHGCLVLWQNALDYVETAATTLDCLAGKKQVTFSFWVKQDEYASHTAWPRIFSIWDLNDGGVDNERVEIECPSGRTSPTVVMSIHPSESTNSDANESNALTWADFRTGWNHYALVKNTDTNSMKIYHNGYKIMDANQTLAPMPQPPFSAFRIGSRENNPATDWWTGRIDDFRVYTRELSASEIATIGTKGTGIYSQPMTSLANLDTNTYNGKQIINFRDFAKMASNWLKTSVWP